MKMSLIVFAALGASFLLRGRSAALRHWVLAAGMACAAALPVLTAALPALPLPLASPTAFTRYEDPFGRAAEAPVPAPRTDAAAAASGPAAARQKVPFSGFSRRAVLQFIWLAGAAVAFGILLTGALRLSWLASHATVITAGRWRDLGEQISRANGLRRQVVLLQSSHPSLLVTWGLLRPKVILPSAAAAWTDERVRVVLSHELAHIRRGDWIVQLFAEFLRAFYWFNPFLWVACRRLRLESEHACDDEVMRGGVKGADYATHLIDLARALNQRRSFWIPAPAMARPSSLERRVRAMLNNHLDRGPLSASRRAAIFVLLLAATSAVAAAQSSFSTYSGSVADEQGRGVPGVAMILVNDARQAKYEVKTNADGRFEFVGLPPGEYSVEAKGIGFQPLKDVLAVVGKNLERSYTLKVGTLQETINVTDGGRDAPQPVIKEVVPKPRPACVPSGAGGQIVPPRKIRDYAPVFPASLRGTGTNGVVIMKALIGLDGYITDITIDNAAHPELASAAVTAVREWKFTETLLNCQPIEVGMTISVNFKGAQLPPAAPPPPQQ